MRIIRGLSQIIYDAKGGGVTLIFYLKHTDFWKMMWMWRTGWPAKLVQGGYIPSAFHQTRLLQMGLGLGLGLGLAMFVCLENF